MFNCALYMEFEMYGEEWTLVKYILKLYWKPRQGKRNVINCGGLDGDMYVVLVDIRGIHVLHCRCVHTGIFHYMGKGKEITASIMEISLPAYIPGSTTDVP